MAFVEEDNMRNRLAKLVECPVCYEVMKNTEMCINGHTVCTRCRHQLTTCPLCTQGFQSVKNFICEEVAELLASKPCCNSSRGCNKYLNENDCKRHEVQCIFRLYVCKECRKEMCFMELKEHYLKDHENKILQPYITAEFKQEENEEGKENFSLLEFNNELFWFWRKNNRAKVYFGLQYCGDSEKISTYKYNFQLVSKSKKSEVEFTAPVLADSQECIAYDISQDYVVLSKNFMGEGSKYQISIAKA